MSVYIDLTEFLKNPLLSGIQRVTAQLCQHWPSDKLEPVKFVDGTGLVTLDRRLVRSIGSYFERPATAIKQLTSRFGLKRHPLRLSTQDTVLVPELFYDPARIAFYEAAHDRDPAPYRFIVYDLKPIEYPEFFPNMPMDIICGYFRMIRRMPHCAFISEATRDAYCLRLLRSRQSTGTVLRLGSDGLGPRPTAAAPPRSMKFTAIGRVEASKNPELILDAFEPLLGEIPDLKLVFIGKIGHGAPGFVAKLSRMSANPASGVEHYSQPGDEMIRAHIDDSRATLFLSGAEGFGLPPVESLWRGTPVIASPEIPSLEKLGQKGIRTVQPLTESGLRQAVLEFSDDSYAVRKAHEALALELPTWKDFAEQVARWCDD
jgi:glycosyltransferase involved in cell wall biosynthesis